MCCDFRDSNCVFWTSVFGGHHSKLVWLLHSIRNSSSSYISSNSCCLFPHIIPPILDQMISRIYGRHGRYSRLNILYFICHHTSPFPVYPFVCMCGNLTSNDFYWTEMWRKMKAGITFRANWILFCFPGFHISNKSFICTAPKRKSLCCHAEMAKNPFSRNCGLLGLRTFSAGANVASFLKESLGQVLECGKLIIPHKLNKCPSLMKDTGSTQYTTKF